MKKPTEFETKNYESVLVNNHSEEITKKIHDLLQQGGIGYEFGLLIDAIDSENIEFENKDDLINLLYQLVKLICDWQNQEPTFGNYDKICHLFPSIENIIDELRKDGVNSILLSFNLERIKAEMKKIINVRNQMNLEENKKNAIEFYEKLLFERIYQALLSKMKN